MEEFSNIYILVMMLSVVVAILSLRYTLLLRNYLREFTIVSKKVSNQEFNARLNISAKGELGELTRNFNYMIKNMDNAFEEVKSKHLQLISILQSISHGILAIDINGNIMLINDEAKRMIKSNIDSPVEDYNINIVIREKQILKSILSFMGSNKSEKVQTTTKQGIVYKIKQDPIYLQNSSNVMIGSIVNIEDITERVRLENMRTDFAANVSHELKTPLTSISGFVETLKSNENIDKDTRNRFLTIIEGESDRLTRLIDDILFISFLEGKDGVPVEEVVLYDVYSEIEQITSHTAENKNIEVKCECDDKRLTITTNKDYLKQVFLNLIDNAIKYTQNNGYVRVKIIDEIDSISIKVKDNGVGIPEDEVDRIFERFYRVDKARSRDVGGTGLGLAITKHIAKSLQGSVLVNSKLGEGSEFVFNIPKKMKNKLNHLDR